MRALVLLLSGLLVFSPGCTKAPPPEFKGKPLVFWVNLLQAKEQPKRLEAISALSEMGHEGAVALAELLRDKDRAVRKRAAQTLIEMQVGSEEVSQWAEEDEDARQILKELCLEERADAYFIALAEAGEESLPIFRDLLKNADRSICWTAAMALEEMRPAEAAIPLLQEVAHTHPHREVRERAAESLRLCCQTD
jgi:HEAT repeat protein